MVRLLQAPPRAPPHVIPHTAHRTQNCKISSSQKLSLFDYKFSDFELDDEGTVKACIRMFVDLDLLNTFQINYEVSGGWVCVYSRGEGVCGGMGGNGRVYGVGV